MLDETNINSLIQKIPVFWTLNKEHVDIWANFARARIIQDFEIALDNGRSHDLVDMEELPWGYSSIRRA